MTMNSLRRIQLAIFGLAMLALMASAASAQGTRHPELIPESMARRHGLTRAWVTRVRVDPSRGRVKELTLHGNALISVTDDGTIQALDSETGRTLWITTVGRRSRPNTAVGANELYVAVCNGSNLYVLRRSDGKLLFERKMEGAPSAAPAVNDDRVYVPTFAGGIESYIIDLEKPQLAPRTYRSKGTIEEPPLLAGDYLIWGTHAGAIYSAERDNLTANFRFMTRGEITAGLGYWPPLVYAASSDGYIYAIEEKKGTRRWQFSTGYPSREPPVALEQNVYVISELSGMFCLDAETGVERWYTRGPDHFISASTTRLYTSDATGALLVLDRRSGAHLDTMPTERLSLQVHNIQTDRLYLATDTGVVQCLREIDQPAPLVHALPPDPNVGSPPADRRPSAAGAAAAKAAAAEAGADGGMVDDAPAAADDVFGGADPQ